MVVARLGTQSSFQAIGKYVGGLVKSLEGAMSVGNMEKISQTMDKVEKVFAIVEVQSNL